ncbi:formyl-coenzyme A transferase [bacterium BMS3Bbin10]|nr:formyl-coenzyme A transferase [bacterium BMS3Bbin10]
MAKPADIETPHGALAKLWTLADGDPAALASVALTGSEPVLPSSFCVGTAAQISIAAAALASAELWKLRGGETQTVSCGMRAAAAEFRSERYFRIDGEPPPPPWDKIAGVYRTGDGRWLRLHTNFPHHRDGVLDILGCAYERDAVGTALENWSASDFEDAAAERGLVVAMMRSFDEWDAHPQGRAVAALPLLEIIRIGDAEPRPLPAGERPLSGIRVLNLTRVIAGPVCGRTLAAHGADVMRVTSPELPHIPGLIADMGRGKLSAFIDLQTKEGCATLRGLAGTSDVFVQGYRPGGIAGLGFSPQEVAGMRPGIIYVSLSAYGHEGPWSDRRGFDSLVQMATGINHGEAEAAGADGPKTLPCQALDHATGHLMACGVMTALHRRATQGGSWLVRGSLAQTGHWLRQMGRVEGGQARADPGPDEVGDLVELAPSGFGALAAVRHAAQMPATPPRWTRPSVPLGTHPPVWPN